MKKTNLRTEAKPPLNFSHNRHNVILLELVIFGGGLTPMPILYMQSQNHLDVPAKELLVFLARRES